MHTLLPPTQLPAAHTARPSPHSAKKHLQLSLALLFSSFTCFLLVPTRSPVPWITARLFLLCSFSASAPLLPQLLLPPDCVQPQHAESRICTPHHVPLHSLFAGEPVGSWQSTELREALGEAALPTPASPLAVAQPSNLRQRAGPWVTQDWRTDGQTHRPAGCCSALGAHGTGFLRPRILTS